MNSNVIAAAIIGASIVLATFVYQYLSPFQTCVRDNKIGVILCAETVSPKGN